MVFSSDKNDKECFYCKKLVKNLGYHIANQHPNVFSKIDDAPPIDNITSPNLVTSDKNNSVYRGNINDMIREKLDTMLNIKIIEMLSKGASIDDITKISQPQATQPAGVTLEEIKKYHDIVFPNGVPKIEGETFNWGELLINALPVIKEMLPQKRKEIEDNGYTNNKDGDIPILKPISQQIAGDTIKSSNISQEPRATSSTEQQYSGISKSIDKRVI